MWKSSLAGQFSFLYLLQKISINLLFKINWLFHFLLVISSAALGNKLQADGFTFKLSLSFSGLEIFGFKDSQASLFGKGLFPSKVENVITRLGSHN